MLHGEKLADCTVRLAKQLGRTISSMENQLSTKFRSRHMTQEQRDAVNQSKRAQPARRGRGRPRVQPSAPKRKYTKHKAVSESSAERNEDEGDEGKSVEAPSSERGGGADSLRKRDRPRRSTTAAKDAGLAEEDRHGTTGGEPQGDDAHVSDDRGGGRAEDGARTVPITIHASGETGDSSHDRVPISVTPAGRAAQSTATDGASSHRSAQGLIRVLSPAELFGLRGCESNSQMAEVGVGDNCESEDEPGVQFS
jgi:hypothetical protein